MSITGYLWRRLQFWRTGPRERSAVELGLREGHAHNVCLNCQTPLPGPYCPLCGQKDDDYRRPFMHLTNEFVSDMVQWDSRLLRSAVPFVFMPGAMTRSFIAGRRGHYVSPLRLYFFISVAFFFALALTNVAIVKLEVHGISDLIAQETGVAPTGPQATVENALRKSGDQLTKRTRPPGTMIEFTTDDGQPVRLGMRWFAWLRDDDEPNDQIPHDLVDRMQMNGASAAEAGAARMWGTRLITATNIALQRPQVFNNIMNVWLPRVMVILVPLVAMVLTILYGRKRRLKTRLYFVDSLVFSIYFHSFIFFVMIVLVLKGRFVGDVVDGSITGWLFLGAIALYLYVGMKTVYQQGYFKTTLKFLFLSFFLLFTYTIALTTVMTYGLIDQATNAAAAGVVPRVTADDAARDDTPPVGENPTVPGGAAPFVSPPPPPRL